MKCSLHPNEDSVAACSKCGAGLCQRCFNSTEYVIDGKHLCRSCNLQLMHDMLAEEKKDAVRSLIKVIFFGVCIGLGVAALLSEPGFNGVASYFFIAGIGCLPTTWKMTANSAKDDAREAIAESQGDYSLTFFGIILRIVLAFVFGGIGAPFVLLFGVIRYLKARVRISKLKNEIEEFKA